MPPKIAIVHEWLEHHAGSERVLEHLLAAYPDATLASLVDFRTPELDRALASRPASTSFLQSLPGSRRFYRWCLPLMPLAVESLDVSNADVVLCNSHAVAKGALTRSDQLHLVYISTPMRYAWDLHVQYLRNSGLSAGVRGLATRAVMHYLRQWDVVSSNRVDAFVANSHYVARRVWKAYRRPAHVIHPPVDVSRFDPNLNRTGPYLAVSRLVPYKRTDLIVEAFNALGRDLIVIGQGTQDEYLRAIAKPNVHFLGWQPDHVIADYMARCRALVFAADEDFGIVPVEAMAAGAPVIAYGKGGVRETVVDGVTGVFFPEHTTASLQEAVLRFESIAPKLEVAAIRAQAEKFAVPRFRQQITDWVDQCLTRFRQGLHIDQMPFTTPPTPN